MTRFRSSTRRPLAGRSGNTLRPVEWIRNCSLTPSTLTPGNVSSIAIVTALEFDDFTRPTVVRIRGMLQLESVTAASANVFATYGITILNPSEPAPDPQAQRRGNRWLWWGCLWLRSEAVATDFVDGVSRYTVPFDVKSMRKRLVDGSELALCITNDAGANGDLNWWVSASTLVKE